MMKKEKIAAFVITVLSVIILGAAFFQYYSFVRREKAELQEKLDYYDGIINGEKKWLASLQQSNGALPFRNKDSGTVKIIPYFSSITAISLLQKSPEPEYKNAVKKYFNWYFAHLNDESADKSCIPGTIYDYSAEVVNGEVKSESTEYEYDSTDSYAALFLTALWEYYKNTGDTGFIIEHYQYIDDILGAMKSTIDRDGLSYAKPAYGIKYLMDNSEVCRGTSCAISLYEEALLPNYDKDTPDYNDIKATIAHLREITDRQEEAFRSILWNEEKKRYETGIDEKGAALDFTGWQEFYPDAVAQLFPIIYGVLPTDSARADIIYRTFSEHFDWEEMSHYENGDTDFYWGLTAYCGALMRDEEKVNSYMDHYMAKVAPDHEYPLYNADAAWVVLASSEMVNFYQEKMNRIDPLGIIK